MTTGLNSTSALDSESGVDQDLSTGHIGGAYQLQFTPSIFAIAKPSCDVEIISWNGKRPVVQIASKKKAVPLGEPFLLARVSRTPLLDHDLPYAKLQQTLFQVRNIFNCQLL